MLVLVLPALQGVHHDMFVELPASHFSARAHDGFTLDRIRGPRAQSLIGERARPFTAPKARTRA